jgi:hypothetical protein
MSRTVTVLNVECRDCGNPLFRFTDANADMAWCLNCGSFATYEEVLRNAPGLIGGSLTPDELNRLRAEAGLHPK